MPTLLPLDICVLIFGVIALIRAVRLLGRPPVKSRIIDYFLVVFMLIVYPGSRFADGSTYETVMEFVFVSPLILLVASGCVMLITGMISAYLGALVPKK